MDWKEVTEANTSTLSSISEYVDLTSVISKHNLRNKSSLDYTLDLGYSYKPSTALDIPLVEQLENLLSADTEFNYTKETGEDRIYFPEPFHLTEASYIQLQQLAPTIKERLPNMGLTPYIQLEQLSPIIKERLPVRNCALEASPYIQLEQLRSTIQEHLPVPLYTRKPRDIFPSSLYISGLRDNFRSKSESTLLDPATYIQFNQVGISTLNPGKGCIRNNNNDYEDAFNSATISVKDNEYSLDNSEDLSTPAVSEIQDLIFSNQNQDSQVIGYTRIQQNQGVSNPGYTRIQNHDILSPGYTRIQRDEGSQDQDTTFHGYIKIEQDLKIYETCHMKHEEVCINHTGLTKTEQEFNILNSECINTVQDLDTSPTPRYIRIERTGQLPSIGYIRVEQSQDINLSE